VFEQRFVGLVTVSFSDRSVLAFDYRIAAGQLVLYL